MTALRVDCGWPLPGTLVVGGVETAFGAWTPVAPGVVRVELRTDVTVAGLRLWGTLALDHEVAAGTAVRLCLPGA